MEKEIIKEKILKSIGFDTPIYPYDLIKKTLALLKMKRTPENIKLVSKAINELLKEEIIEEVKEDLVN